MSLPTPASRGMITVSHGKTRGNKIHGNERNGGGCGKTRGFGSGVSGIGGSVDGPRPGGDGRRGGRAGAGARSGFGGGFGFGGGARGTTDGPGPGIGPRATTCGGCG